MADENIYYLLDLASLIYRQRAGALSPIEQTALDDWRAADPANQALFDELSRADWLDEDLAVLDPAALRASAARVYQALGRQAPAIPMAARPSLTRRLVRWTAAAAVLAAIATGAYFGFFRPRHGDLTQTPAIAQNDVAAPTGAKTTLTLAGGQIIILDSVKNGNLARQGNTQIAKLSSNQLAYQPSPGTTTVAYNLLSTAKGGQTMVTLADGTKVWLNALSSLRFPTAFAGGGREVELTGEAYFEVAKNAAQPFKVRAGRHEIEVLGTSFDVNAYLDEPDLITTLFQGAVRIHGRTLAPGEQAAVDKGGQLCVRKDIDADEVLAWKNGEFVFNRTDMTAILRQVARWYDVDIVSPAQPVTRTFSGIVSRGSNLSEVMKIFENAGIRFRMERK